MAHSSKERRVSKSPVSASHRKQVQLVKENGAISFLSSNIKKLFHANFPPNDGIDIGFTLLHILDGF